MDSRVEDLIDEIEPLLQAEDLELAKAQALTARDALGPHPSTKNGLLQLARVAGYLIDIGGLTGEREVARLGLEMLQMNDGGLEKVVQKHSFLYCVANGKSNVAGPWTAEGVDFGSVRELVEVKNSFWRAVKAAGEAPPEYLVNLANSLKQQFRIVEALDWYVYPASVGIFQAHLNRADALRMLNAVSHSYSIKMLDEVALGYRLGALLCDMPQLRDRFELQAEYAENVARRVRLEKGVDFTDDHEQDEVEFSHQSAFRKFCITERLALSEHSLYCGCVGSARDNLTIPTLSGVAGDFIVSMEAALNRIKSEYAFCRRLYYEYLYHEPDEDLLHESCFSDLLDGELLGLEAEKLRTAFKGCFGILDKIAEAVCELLGLHPPKGKIYFESFWQLERTGRLAQFDQVRSPGLLALYSVATDLSGAEGGEWSFFKKWRNALEHGVLVIRSDGADDPLGILQNRPHAISVSETEFVSHLKHILSLTRSAIFSFVFTVRDRGLEKEGLEDVLSIPMRRKNYRAFE